MNQAQNNWEGVSTLQNSLANGFAGVNQALCNGFAGVQNGFAQAEIAANSRQMADMNQNFALQSQLAQCCCENRLATANLNSTIIAENCADREALNSIGRDIIASQNAGTQRILDQMCNDKIDAKNEKIADLERQLTLANLAASQGAQTAAIIANNEAQTTALEQYLAPTPRPAYIVQNPNCCPQNSICGCGNGFAN
jgi:hypothetical protein